MESSQQNKNAWNNGTYQSWVNRFGTPEEAAEKIKQDPQKRIGTAFKHMEDHIQGKKIINLLGSNGNKAVALALLGAELTIVDFSAENEQYAQDLARAAGVPLQYIVSDVLQLPLQELANQYDIVFMEFGILHYFTDLQPLFHVVSSLLASGGQLVLQDFHPISTKLITSKGTTANIRKHKVTGDYFDTSLTEKAVSYSKYAESDQQIKDEQKVYLRQWTIGEIVTAVATSGLMIKVLEELPNQSSEVFDKGIPKTFTIVAQQLHV
ncbi:2-polyprenyl-3-methyl-5-hydroxy-6-metoxy-1,4-benzoquinol methylase [Paenibacillus sp. SORGH_AS306]|uniref:class I SAM-dependent methyltransferase n=1 Tax=unclassified Paenibacillus TaxID=185978 RepID=UPI00277EB730|nr:MULTISPECIES: class I SAM-dependent methyltransferase [unclassified Paenibacillus]MDQ1236410.1 2-polyprenyl-3-methyl-5-hydroxy-6-metoxy-1,4-benzoquinol methylase [Paenibacillus sp. SORGH_AS_0306]MDR6108763.1 2-polyprenyl-3-methyl-5-hydroxy-6-metoxy-1,4-benzoquinol methylase [Paenibacillus sp. SORGH_AS_0338]